MRRIRALLLAALLCLTLCACRAEEPPPPTELPEQPPSAEVPEVKSLTLAYDPTADLHPITGTGQVNQMLTSLVYEGLYALDEKFTPRAVLARETSVNDTGLVWTITVREGVTFSDGTPLEAAHVVSSLNTARKSSLYRSRLSDISSVRSSKGAVVITLSRPNGSLPALLDIPVVLEQEELSPPLGTGRYRYLSDGESLSLSANKAGLPYDSISLCPVTDTAERIAAFDSGAVSAVTTDLFSPYAPGYSSTHELWDYPTADLLYVGFNAADGPCLSPQVRQAFARAFDRCAITGETLCGYGDPAALPVFPTHGDWSDEHAALLEYDAAAAAELLALAGYTLNEEDGLLYDRKTPLSVELLVNSDNTAKTAVAAALAEDLQALGITVTVTGLPWHEYTAALKAGRFDLYLGEVRLTADFDLTQLLTGSLNYGNYDPAPLAQSLEARRAAADGDRHEAVLHFWDGFTQEVPFAPLCFERDALLIHWGAAAGVSPTMNDPFYNLEQWH